jgi:thiol:disulfide interchange protein DsbD
LVSGCAPKPAPSIFSSDLEIASLFQRSTPLVLGGFLVFGLLLAFTPCVLPMIPILSGIIAGEGASLSKSRALSLSLAYVIGMAAAYAIAGVAAAYSGSLLAAARQNAWVLGGFALVFVLLALSMFGLYELKLPGSCSASTKRNAAAWGPLASVAGMGALSAVIVSPCVAAPLAGALLTSAQTRDVALGGAALFAMALGMGVPLVVVGAPKGRSCRGPVRG